MEIDHKSFLELVKAAELLRKTMILVDEAFQGDSKHALRTLGRIRAEIKRSGVKL